jgi:hypothetical protein
LLAVQAVERELVSERYFPVLREKTGNFGENGRFEAKNVTKNRDSSVSYQ